MPTAGRLVAALCLAGVGWIGSEMMRPLLPPETDFGWFNEVNLALGLVCGWVVTGRRLGRGYAHGFSAGLTGLGALIFWALFFQSLNEMLVMALRRRYDGPVEAIVGMFEIALDYGRYLLDGPLVGVLLTGGVLTGIIAEWVTQRGHRGE